MNNIYKIIPLPKEKWEGTIIPMRYTTEEYFDVHLTASENGYQVSIDKCKFDSPVSHYPEEYDFPDKLYQAHWEKAYAWGIVREEGDHRELAIAKEQAVLEHRRAIILETQSCNVGAISFYRQEGFELIGFDSCCYSNRDIERKEVRFNMGYFPRKNGENKTSKTLIP